MHICAPRGRKPTKKKAKREDERDVSPKRITPPAAAAIEMNELQQFIAPLSEIYVTIAQQVGEHKLTVENINKTYEALWKTVSGYRQRQIDGTVSPEEVPLMEQKIQQLTTFELLHYTHAKLFTGMGKDFKVWAMRWMLPAFAPLLDWTIHFERAAAQKSWPAKLGMLVLSAGLAIPTAVAASILPHIFLLRKFTTSIADMVTLLVEPLYPDATKEWWKARETELYALKQLREADHIDQEALEKQIAILEDKVSYAPWNLERYKLRT